MSIREVLEFLFVNFSLYVQQPKINRRDPRHTDRWLLCYNDCKRQMPSC
jgi:hypothetical protein